RSLGCRGLLCTSLFGCCGCGGRFLGGRLLGNLLGGFLGRRRACLACGRGCSLLCHSLLCRSRRCLLCCRLLRCDLGGGRLLGSGFCRRLLRGGLGGSLTCLDRKSTRLNSSHVEHSYGVF